MKYCQFLFNSWKFSRAAFKGTVAPNLLVSFLAYFSLWNVSYQNARRTLNLRDGCTNLKSLWFVHTFLGEPLTNWGKIRWICKNVSNKNDELNIHLREKLTPCEPFFEKEIVNLREPLPAFVNLSRKFQEPPSSFGIKL